MTDVSISAERFYQRLQRLIDNWTAERTTTWGSADVICIPHGGRSEDNTNYTKSAAMQLYLLGYEIPDSIMLITRREFYFMATEKKCKHLETPLGAGAQNISCHYLVRTKDEGLTREHFNTLLNVVRKGGGSSLGSMFKQEYVGEFIPSWHRAVEASQLTMVEIPNALGLFLSVKDAAELVSSS
jgi:nucleosome binding factor SPN SPT16 subunit